MLFNPIMNYLSAVEMMNMRHDRQNQDALNVSTILALYFLYPFSRSTKLLPYAECELLKLGLTITVSLALASYNVRLEECGVISL